MRGGRWERGIGRASGRGEGGPRELGGVFGAGALVAQSMVGVWLAVIDPVRTCLTE